MIPAYWLPRPAIQLDAKTESRLEAIRAHDDAVLAERVKADPSGFPWI